MNKDEIMRMAREAKGDLDDGVWLFMPDELERFAAIVAAVEREKCAEICDQEAKRAEEWSTGLEVMSADRCAVAIRKRSTDAP